MPPTQQTKPVEVRIPRPFEDEVAGAMAELRGSLAGLVGSIPEPVARPVDLERQLRVDKKLAWQVFRLTKSSGFEEVENVPPRASMRRLLAAGEARGAPAAVVARVWEAFERFEGLAVTHGGDREGLVSLVAGLAGGSSEQYELKMRRSLFRANAHVWGVQAQVQVRTMIIRGAGGPGGYHGVLVAGDIGLQRRDPKRPLVVSARLQTPNPAGPGAADSGALPTSPNSPTAPGGNGSAGPELLLEHCSKPVPRLVPQPSPAGEVETEMVFPASGRAGAITLYTCRSVDAGDDGRESVSCQMFIAMPAEAVVCDLVLPAGWTDPASARVAVYGRRHHPERVYEHRKADLFPQREKVTYMGASESIPPIAGAPRHEQAVRDVLERHGCGGMVWDVYRCRVEYPVLHTLLVLRVDPVEGGGA